MEVEKINQISDLWQNLTKNTDFTSKSTFLKTDTQKITFQQSTERILVLSKNLHDQIKNTENIISRDNTKLGTIIIGILMPTGMDYVLVILALLLLKSKFPYLILIPLNHYKPDVILNQEIKQAGITILISNFTHVVHKKLLSCHNIYYQSLKLKKTSAIELAKWKHTVSTLSKTNRSSPEIGLFTSGSGGKPKLAAFTWQQFLNAAESAHRFLPFNKTDAWLVTLPFYHVSGFSLIARAINRGGKLIFAKNNKTWWKAVSRHQISHISLVPAQLPSLERLPKLKKHLSTLKLVLVGGGPVEVSHLANLNQKLGRTDPPLFRATYGLTESLAQVATGDAGENNPYPYRILPGRKIKILCGEIYIHQDSMFCGYMRLSRPNPKEQDYSLLRPWTKAGWFSTGDLGKKQGERINILGRKDRQFISGGENIYPEEIERVIQGFVAGFSFKRGWVISEPHHKWGMVPIAIVEQVERNIPATSGKATSYYGRKLHEFLCSRLEVYKVPRKYFELSTEIKQYFGGIKISSKQIEQEYYKNPKAFKLIYRVTELNDKVVAVRGFKK